MNLFAERLKLRLHDLHWKTLNHAQREQYIKEKLCLENSSWLFLNGMNNSGTKLLVQLLDTHPELRCLEREGQFLTSALPNPKEFGAPRAFSTHLERFRWDESSTASDPQRVQFDWAYHYPQRPGILVEKSPCNAVRSRWLQKHFKPAAFLATIRDPYATCEGIRRRDGTPIEYAAAHWAICNEILMDDLQFLEKAMIMRYEDLCADPLRELERVREFLNLSRPFEHQVVKTTFRVENVANHQSTIRDFNSQSHAKLSRRDFDTINRIAGHVIERLGYSRKCAAAAA